MMPCRHAATRTEPTLIPFISRTTCERCERWTLALDPGPGTTWHVSHRARRIARTVTFSAEDVQEAWEAIGEAHDWPALEEREALLKTLLHAARLFGRRPAFLLEQLSDFEGE